jgi:hypothetical protein
MSATTAATPRSKPLYLLRVINGPRRAKQTHVVPIRMREDTFAALRAFTAGAAAASMSRVTMQSVLTAAIDAYLATARPSKVNTAEDAIEDGDLVEAAIGD